jgi:hypothetical protein
MPGGPDDSPARAGRPSRPAALSRPAGRTGAARGGSASARPAKRPSWFRRTVPAWSVPLIVVAVLLVGELAARFVGPSIPRTAGTEERMFVKSDQIYERGSHATDVAIFGSSETAGGLIPSAMAPGARGLDGIYNAGLSGSELTLIREWADRIVVPNLKPKVAVIGMLPMTVGEANQTGVKGAESQEAALGAYRTAIEQVDPGGVGSLGWRLRQHSGLIRYRPYLRTPRLAVKGAWVALHGGHHVTQAELDADATMDWTKETDPRRVKRNTAADGEVFDYRRQSVDTPSDPIGARLYELFAKAPTTFTQLDRLVRDLKANGVQPVLAIAPVDRTPLTAAGADLSPLDQVAGQIVRWGREHGVPVDDQFTEHWDSALFHDRNHLDLAGSRRWSRQVGRFLGDLCEQHRLADAC